MSCEKFQKLFYGYICDALSPKQKTQVEKHIYSGCKDCKKKLEEIQERLVKARGKTPEAPKLNPYKIIQKAHRRVMWLRYISAIVLIFIFFIILIIGLFIARYRYERILIEELTKAVFIYRIHKGSFPSSEKNLLKQLNSVPETQQYLIKWRNRINHKQELVDYWDNPIIYKFPGKFNPGLFDIYSYGINGKYDHGKWDDIRNWIPSRNKTP